MRVHRRIFGMRLSLPIFVLVLGLAYLGSTLLPPRNPGAFDCLGFGRLPALADGRLKPMDTIARSSLLRLQGRQSVTAPSGRSLTPEEWLLDMFFRSETADTYAVFAIGNPEVFALIGKSDSETIKRVSYRELAPYLGAIEAQAKLAEPVDDRARTPFQRAVLQLAENLVLYQQLEHTLQPPAAADFLGEVLRFQGEVPAGVAAVRAKQAGKPHD
jgi:hypothetical protein